MRLVVGKVWRAFPELDPFSDELCARFVVAARRGLRAKRWQWPLLFGLGWVSVLSALSAGALVFAWTETSATMRSGPTGVHYALAGAATTVVALPLFWLVYRVRDGMLRRRIRYVIKARGSCPACGYFLGGVPVLDEARVICPECAMECTVDPALGELAPGEGGRARYKPQEQHLPRPARWLTAARMKKFAKVAIILILAAGFIGAAWWGVWEWRLREQAKLAAAERPGVAAALQLVVDNQAPGVTEADTNAYDVFARLLAKITTVESGTEVPERLLKDSKGTATYLDYSLLIYDEPETGELAVNAELNGLVRERSRLVLEAQRAAGTFDLMQEMAACQRAERPLAVSAPGDPLVQVLLPDLAKCRQIARMNGARMHAAVKAGDFKEFAEALEVNLAEVRMIDHQPFLIDRLVSIAIEALCMGRVREALAAHPDAAWLDAIEGAFERQRSGVPFSLQFRGERLFGLDSAAWFYSDPKRVKGRNAGPLMTPAPLAVGNYVQTRDTMNVVYAEFIADADAERWLRPARKRGRTGVWMVDGGILPAASKAYSSFDQITLERRGLTVMIALERHRLKHGAYPGTLDDLAPAHLPALPLDPWSGRPFCYKRIDPATDPQKRAYLLWSVGHDGADNGGTPVPAGAGSAYESLHGNKHPGTDLIINDRDR